MRSSVILLLVGAVFSPALASAQVPAGSEFQVNTYTTAFASLPAAAMDAAGRLVVSWSTPGSGGGVFTRRFDAAGTPVSNEFTVVSGLSFYASSHVASSFAGDFVVTWVSFVGGPLGTSAVVGRHFSSEGTPGTAFSMGSPKGFSPQAARTTDGGFVVVWWGRADIFGTNNDVRGQRFDASGAKVGAEFGINTYTTGTQSEPGVAVNAQGDFLVAWQSSEQDGSGYGIYAQRFNPAGASLGGEFRVNGVTAADQTNPKAAAAADGSFVVMWQSDGQDGSGKGLFGRRFAGDGAPVGVEFQVNTYTTLDQFDAAVAADVAGDFVVSWTSVGQDGSGPGVFAQRFTPLAERRGAEFRANATTALAQYASSVGMDPYGNMTVVWSAAGQGGSSQVFAQRFGGLYGTALSVDTSGNGVLEPGESVDVRPSWRNLNGAPQAFGGQMNVIVGPPGATYSITDATGNYGLVANGAVAPCIDCYGIAVSSPPSRPAPHWDVFTVEAIVPDAQGQQKPWAFHVGASFADVPPSSLFYRFVETLFHRSVTAGCGPAQFCPGSATTREQMAPFVLVAKQGAGYTPPPCGTPMFADVPASSAFCRFIEELARRGVVAGCGGGNYCPTDAVSREQMAVFVLRTLDPTLDPPACTTPVFTDVPASSVFCRWIEELARRGVVSGCGGGQYCPAAAVSREQMGVFLSVTFGLTLYG